MACKITYRGKRYDTLKELVNDNGLADSIKSAIQNRYSPAQVMDMNKVDMLVERFNALTKAEVDSILSDTKSANLTQVSKRIISSPILAKDITNETAKLIVDETINGVAQYSGMDVLNKVQSLQGVDDFNIALSPIAKESENVEQFFDACSI